MKTIEAALNSRVKSRGSYLVMRPVAELATDVPTLDNGEAVMVGDHAVASCDTPLWSVADTATVRVARDVYDALARDGELDAAGSAKALHAAVRALRTRHPGTPSMWAPFLHVGP